MKHSSVPVLVLITFLTVLGGTVLIPAVRPFFAAVHPGSEGALHAFMSVNMLGGALCAPVVAFIADRSRRRRSLTLLLLLIDATLMLAAAYLPSLALTLVLRTIQGGASVGALSIVMGALGERLRQNEAAGERQVHGGSLGLASAAVVSAIAVGAPLGALCVNLGMRAALIASAAFSLCAFLLVLIAMVEPAADSAKKHKFRLSAWREVRVAAFFVAVERFGVGSFVVTFSLYAHAALGKTDAQIGLLYSLFLVPFAACSVAAPFLLRHIAREVLLLGGGLAYGACIAAFGQTEGAALMAVLFVAGIASSVIYAPALCIAAAGVPHELRATAMGITNAAGTLGMMSGTALCGAASVLLMNAGVERVDTYRWIFAGAGAAVAFGFVVELTSAVSAKRSLANP